MFTEALWKSWSEKENSNYKIKNGKPVWEKKAYTHFDYLFWFPDRKKELKYILENNLRVFKKEIQRTEYWSFSPFLKILVNTPRYRYQEDDEQYDLETKIRPICFASHIDSLIFGFYSFCLTKKYEEYIKKNNFDECVLAYRSDLGLCNIQFAKEVFEKIISRQNCTAIALDIKGYFDNIDHIILKEKWSKVLEEKLPEDQYRIYKNITQYSYVNKSSLLKKFKGKKSRNEKKYPTLLHLIPGVKDFEKFKLIRDKKLVVTNDKPDKKTKRLKGIPQGSALSALLSNIFMIDYDLMMNDKAKSENFIYRRYCDDILIICDTDKATELQEYAISKINEDYFLTIQQKKVETIDFHLNSQGIFRAFKRNKKNPNVPAKSNSSNEHLYYKSLQYLGFEFNGKDIFVRSSSLSRYFRKMRSRIVKTVSMAYGATAKSDKIFKKQIIQRYTHIGKRNFLSYAYKASAEFYYNSRKEIKEGLNSPAIKKQVSRHFSILINNLRKKNAQRIIYKQGRNKKINVKTI